jgi:hypothetical protein
VGADKPKNNFLFNAISEQLHIQIISRFGRADLEWLTAEIRAKLFERSEFLARRSKVLKIGKPKARPNGCPFFGYFSLGKQRKVKISSSLFLPGSVEPLRVYRERRWV